jgi:hypothetical protein
MRRDFYANVTNDSRTFSIFVSIKIMCAEYRSTRFHKRDIADVTSYSTKQRLKEIHANTIFNDIGGVERRDLERSCKLLKDAKPTRLHLANQYIK